jgi:SAM-dependent methyltransferase
MRDSAELQSYLSAGHYTAPVDLKKLRFIFTVLGRFAAREEKKFTDLKVLEGGCGIGGITLPLASLGCRVRAFDSDETDVESLRRVIDSRGYENVTVTVDDAFEFDDGEQYDVVVASEVFEHVLDPPRLAAVVKRHLYSGGVFILTVPNGYGPFELKNAVSPHRVARRWNWLRRLLGKGDYRAGGRDHCQKFTKNRLISMFSELSLDLVEFAKSDGFFAVFRPLREHAFWGKIDARLADAMPYWMASGWFMVFELKNDGHLYKTL